MIIYILFLHLLIFSITINGFSEKNESKKRLYGVNVECTDDTMEVLVNINATDKDKPLIYLDKLKGYPDVTCQPKRNESQLIYSLPIGENFYSCGTNRISDKDSNKIYYNRLIIEQNKNGINDKDIVIVSCIVSQTNRAKRQVENEWDFPENFTESIEELIDYSGNVTQRAPIPYLNIGIRQNGEFVDTELNIHPGTPLEMIIYLDDESAKVYGILGTFLKVTDKSPSQQEEVIILNGCSIDPYIFSNFQTRDSGNSIFSKFRAFKFPESNFVLFVGTVNVCLKECQGVPCGDNIYGYGKRRKRSIPDDLPPDPNKIFEVEMTAFLRVAPTPNQSSPAKKAETIRNAYEEKQSKRTPKNERTGEVRKTFDGNNNSLLTTTKQMPLQFHSPNDAFDLRINYLINLLFIIIFTFCH